MSRSASRQCVVLVLLTLWLANICPAATLHVSTDGSDEADGSPGAPLATLEAAVHKARQMRTQNPDEPVVIEVAPGRYELSATLELNSDDSALTIQAAAKEPVVLSGGRRITGWQRDQTRDNLWTVTLDEVRSGDWYFHQLFVAGERWQRARTPNEGYLRAAGTLGTRSPIDLPYHPGDLKPEWTELPDARLIMLMKWTDLHVPISAIDESRHIAKFPGRRRARWMNEPDARYWIENVPDALDAPGEWYLDRKTGQLSLLADESFDPDQTLVVAPRLLEIVRVAGQTDPPEGSADDRKAGVVRDIRFRGLTFSDCDYEMPAEGLISPQAAAPVRGTFRATHAVGCSIENCVFENLGGYAVDLGRGTQRWRMVGNRVRSIGGGGVRIGEMTDREPTERDACLGHEVTDNTLSQLGRVFAPACGVIIFQSGSNHIAHNHIHDLYYTGISVGWNWGYRETPCRDNVIEFNLVENVGQGRLSDMGGIYTLGPQPGTIIRNNIFRKVTSYNYGGWGLYTDEGSTGIVMENNVSYQCTDAGFHQHYGRDNIVRNNILAFNRNHSVMRTRVEPHLSFKFTHNVVIADSGTLLGSNWDGTTEQFLCDYNVWFDTRLGADAEQYRFANQSWQEWQARGQDQHSIIADPKLIDPQKPELGLQSDSPAFDVGFKQIDLSTVGPRAGNSKQ